MRYDYDGTKVIYIGVAPRGMASSSANWIIFKLTYSGDLVTLVQSVENKDWDNRASHVFA